MSLLIKRLMELDELNWKCFTSVFLYVQVVVSARIS